MKTMRAIMLDNQGNEMMDASGHPIVKNFDEPMWRNLEKMPNLKFKPIGWLEGNEEKQEDIVPELIGDTEIIESKGAKIETKGKSYKELQSIAKENGIKVFGKKKADLIKEISKL